MNSRTSRALVDWDTPRMYFATLIWAVSSVLMHWLLMTRAPVAFSSFGTAVPSQYNSAVMDGSRDCVAFVILYARRNIALFCSESLLNMAAV